MKDSQPSYIPIVFIVIITVTMALLVKADRDASQDNNLGSNTSSDSEWFFIDPQCHVGDGGVIENDEMLSSTTENSKIVENDLKVCANLRHKLDVRNIGFCRTHPDSTLSRDEYNKCHPI